MADISSGANSALTPHGGGNRLIKARFRQQHWRASSRDRMCVCVCVCVCAQLCPTLCNPIDCGLPGSSICGILPVRVLE